MPSSRKMYGGRVMKRVFSILGLLIALIVFAAPAASAPAAVQVLHHPRVPVREGTSSNWSGYAVETNLMTPQNNAVTDVKGQWVVPAVNPSSGNTYSAAWIGIDGYSDNTVEQIGTEQDWINGAPSYYAWFEMYPKWGYLINNPVSAGDTMSAEVKYIGNNQFVLTLNDVSSVHSPWTFSITQKAASARLQSAEWIMEAPWSGGVLPLANFSTVNFSNAQATLNGHSGPIDDKAWKKDCITMNDPHGGTATPSSLKDSNNTSSFSVTYSP